MKTIQNFAVQQLTKKQMNKVKGGWSCLVVTKWGEGDQPNEGYRINVPGSNAEEALANAGRLEGAVGIIC